MPSLKSGSSYARKSDVNEAFLVPFTRRSVKDLEDDLCPPCCCLSSRGRKWNEENLYIWTPGGIRRKVENGSYISSISTLCNNFEESESYPEKCPYFFYEERVLLKLPPEFGLHRPWRNRKILTKAGVTQRRVMALHVSVPRT